MMQNSKIIAYASKQLKDYEQKYPTHDDLELATVVFALIFGDIISTKNSVEYAQIIRISSISFSQKELNIRQRRWSDLVKDYDCEIFYHPGYRLVGYFLAIYQF